MNGCEFEFVLKSLKHFNFASLKLFKKNLILNSALLLQNRKNLPEKQSFLPRKIFEKTINLCFALILAASSINVFKCTAPLNVYEKGNMNLIITMPHGGLQQPENTEDRKAGQGVTSFTATTDALTIELGKALRNKLQKRFNLKPHMVYTNVRRKVDFNRN